MEFLIFGFGGVILVQYGFIFGDTFCEVLTLDFQHLHNEEADDRIYNGENESLDRVVGEKAKYEDTYESDICHRSEGRPDGSDIQQGWFYLSFKKVSIGSHWLSLLRFVYLFLYWCGLFA